MSENPTFTGNAEQRALAEQVFQIMKTQGAFFAADAPIRQTLANLADFFAAQRKADRGKHEPDEDPHGADPGLLDVSQLPQE